MVGEENPEGVGPVQGQDVGNPDANAGQASRDGDHQTGRFDAGDFVVDHDADPPEEVQPTTAS